MLFINRLEVLKRLNQVFTFQFLKQERFSTSPLCIQAYTDGWLHGWFTENISQSAAVQIIAQHVTVRLRRGQVSCNTNTVLYNSALRKLFSRTIFIHKVTIHLPIFVYILLPYNSCIICIPVQRNFKSSKWYIIITIIKAYYKTQDPKPLEVKESNSYTSKNQIKTKWSTEVTEYPTSKAKTKGIFDVCQAFRVFLPTDYF